MQDGGEIGNTPNEKMTRKLQSVTTERYISIQQLHTQNKWKIDINNYEWQYRKRVRNIKHIITNTAKEALGTRQNLDGKRNYKIW